jgi:hypothetical protein
VPSRRATDTVISRSTAECPTQDRRREHERPDRSSRARR